MKRYISCHYTTLDDASYFLNQVCGLPETATSTPLRRRYVSTCIVLSWVAVEQALRDTIGELRKTGRLPAGTKRGLADRIEEVLNVLGHTFVPADFFRLRKVRNHLTHANRGPMPLDLSHAEESFHYCKGLIELLLSVHPHWEFKVLVF